MAKYLATLTKLERVRTRAALSPMGVRRDTERRQDRLPVAADAPRFSSLEDSLHHLLELAERRDLGAYSPSGNKLTDVMAIVDSQSVCSAEGGEERGYDEVKKITGRKRHIAIDTLGLVLVVVVHDVE
ncbi:transposase [Bythopirellula polymerisocia]|uniref:Transposase IS4-like domain-containing protein n=1 Tax=Bythopirellula polymerisocia TaxID=2528003 RepID=A0A5C6CM25_9BACT|nr:transposase [Bythopirellula polymerisocia]TWU25973.1 hypothetical protein Pla144_31870 [Bythopirellula polymerisocia]